MSGAPQLERSVLEGKERDELLAIAVALGQKAGARAKKSDLVDVILRATGVDADPSAVSASDTKPRRSPRKRATGALPEPAAGDTAEPPRGRDEEAEGSPASLPMPVDGAGPHGSERAAEQAPAASEAQPDEVQPDEVQPGQAQPAQAKPGDAQPSPAQPGQIQPGQAQPASSQPSTRTSAEPRPYQPRVPQQPPGPPGPGNHASPPAQAQQEQHRQQGQQGQQGQRNQESQPGPQGEAGPGGGPEGEVRRNRRRRGRDRLGPGYDQQAQQADQAFSGEPVPCDGLLDLRPEGFGFLRTGGYLPGAEDVYVSISQVRRFALRAGDRIVGASRPATTQERFGALLRIDAVGELNADQARRRPRFEDLTPLFPDEQLKLEMSDPADPANTTGRIIDLLSPIGKGQRGMIVSPPKAGKTTVMKHIATAIAANHPEVDLIVLLVDERPEEVTDMRRSVKGEVIGSTFDRPAEEHAQVAELVIQVAKRRVELGRDVVIILDGITRLSRAYNLAAPASGRIMSGGLDSAALYPPKRFFGAARNVEEGGSLTILATALVETGSAMDTVIFEEFKGTGNMELRLDRRLAERRMYPAIDVTGSSTRHEELLLTKDELHLVWQLRRVLVALGQESSGHKGYELLLDRLKHSRTNADFLADLARTPS